MIHDDLSGHDDVLDAVIYSNEEYGVQVRMTVSEFLGRHYMGFRQYYLSYEGEWLPTKNGMSFPYSLDTTTRLFSAFAQIMSKAEITAEVIENHNKSSEED